MSQPNESMIEQQKQQQQKLIERKQKQQKSQFSAQVGVDSRYEKSVQKVVDKKVDRIKVPNQYSTNNKLIQSQLHQNQIDQANLSNIQNQQIRSKAKSKNRDNKNKKEAKRIQEEFGEKDQQKNPQNEEYRLKPRQKQMGKINKQVLQPIRRSPIFTIQNQQNQDSSQGDNEPIQIQSDQQQQRQQKRNKQVPNSQQQYGQPLSQQARRIFLKAHQKQLRLNKRYLDRIQQPDIPTINQQHKQSSSLILKKSKQKVTNKNNIQVEQKITKEKASKGKKQQQKIQKQKQQKQKLQKQKKQKQEIQKQKQLKQKLQKQKAQKQGAQNQKAQIYRILRSRTQKEKLQKEKMQKQKMEKQKKQKQEKQKKQRQEKQKKQRQEKQKPQNKDQRKKKNLTFLTYNPMQLNNPLKIKEQQFVQNTTLFLNNKISKQLFSQYQKAQNRQQRIKQNLQKSVLSINNILQKIRTKERQEKEQPAVQAQQSQQLNRNEKISFRTENKTIQKKLTIAQLFYVLKAIGINYKLTFPQVLHLLDKVSGSAKQLFQVLEGNTVKLWTKQEDAYVVWNDSYQLRMLKGKQSCQRRRSYLNWDKINRPQQTQIKQQKQFQQDLKFLQQFKKREENQIQNRPNISYRKKKIQQQLQRKQIQQKRIKQSYKDKKLSSQKSEGQSFKETQRQKRIEEFQQYVQEDYEQKDKKQDPARILKDWLNRNIADNKQNQQQKEDRNYQNIMERQSQSQEQK